MSPGPEKVPLNQRLGLSSGKPIDHDFPATARTALTFLLEQIHNETSYATDDSVLMELYRTARLTTGDFEFTYNTPFFDKALAILSRMQWWQVLAFCERYYERHIPAAGWVDDGDNFVETSSKDEMCRNFADEINTILAEENLAFHFVNGEFQRRGRAHTQVMSKRVGAVLAPGKFAVARNHYNKARAFFDERPDPDVENCVKEALCALEACLETLTGAPASKEFARSLKRLEGNAKGQIPPPLVEAMIKLHAYRGSGTGVAHAAQAGPAVSELEAELVLNLTASYITYLADLLVEPESEIPF